MKRDEIQIGGYYTYYPAKKDKDDNRHPRCVVDGFSPSGRVRILYSDESGSRKASVSARSLSPQSDMYASS